MAIKVLRVSYKKNIKIEIEWDDASCHHGWRSEGILDKDVDVERCRTIGYFYKETKAGIRLSSAIGDTGSERSDTWTIPKSCIHKVRELK